jgi:hypothetical protein
MRRQPAQPSDFAQPPPPQPPSLQITTHRAPIPSATATRQVILRRAAIGYPASDYLSVDEYPAPSATIMLSSQTRAAATTFDLRHQFYCKGASILHRSPPTRPPPRPPSCIGASILQRTDASDQPRVPAVYHRVTHNAREPPSSIAPTRSAGSPARTARPQPRPP